MNLVADRVCEMPATHTCAGNGIVFALIFLVVVAIACFLLGRGVNIVLDWYVNYFIDRQVREHREDRE